LLTWGAAWGFFGGSAVQGVASAVNGALLLYAISAFVGWEHGWRDVSAQIRPPWHLPRARKQRQSS
jgi:hypothetical protein